eukprot:jgi/Tetstr1/423884/TSEL_014507.t1
MSIPKLHAAASSGDVATLKLFLSNDDVDHIGKVGRTLLHSAAQKGQMAVVRELLQRRAAVNLRDKHGRTPLHVASHMGHLKTVAELCAAGADLEAKTASGRTPLHLAAWEGKVEVCMALSDQGAKLHTRDQGGKTALHFAVWGGKLAVVEQLLRRGAEVEVEDESGRTPLLVAAKFGHGDIVHALLEAGANMAACDSKGSTAQELASVGGFEAVVEVLRKFDERKAKRRDGGAGQARKPGAGQAPKAVRPAAVKADPSHGAAATQLSVHVDLTDARALERPKAPKPKAAKVPRKAPRSAASSLNTTIEEAVAAACKEGPPGSVAFRGQQQPGASLMMTNPAYTTDNCSECSVFEDGDSSLITPSAMRETKASGVPAGEEAAQLPKIVEDEISRSGWSDESIDGILQEMVGEPTGRQPAPARQILEIPEEMQAFAELPVKPQHAQNHAAPAQPIEKVTAQTQSADADGWDDDWEDMDVDEMFAAVGDVMKAGKAIERLANGPSKPTAQSDTTCGSSSTSSSRVASASQAAAKPAEKKPLTKKVKKVAAGSKKAVAAKDRPAAGKAPASEVSAMRRRAEDAEARAAQAGRAMERMAELETAKARRAAPQPQPPSAGDQHAQRREMESLQARLEASQQQKARLEKELRMVKTSLSTMEHNMSERLSQLSEDKSQHQSLALTVERLKRRLAESDAARATLERKLAEEAAAKDTARARLAAVEAAAEAPSEASGDAAALMERVRAAEAQRDATLAAVEARAHAAGGGGRSELAALMEMEELRIRAEAAEAQLARQQRSGVPSERQLLQADIGRDTQVKQQMDAEKVELGKLQAEYRRQRKAMDKQLAELRAQVGALEELKAGLISAENERGAMDTKLEALLDETARLANAPQHKIRASVTGERQRGVAAAAGAKSLQDALQEIGQLRAELAQGRELRWELEQESKTLQVRCEVPLPPRPVLVAYS